jgi:hypothetical protein
VPTSSDPGLPRLPYASAGEPSELLAAKLCHKAGTPAPTTARPTAAGLTAWWGRGRLRPRHRGLVRRTRSLRPVVRIAATSAVLLVVAGAPAFGSSGASSLTSVIDNLQTWLVGILVGVATLFLTIGGLRYITAGGDPMQVERAKTALKFAAIGYALAALAPLLVSVLRSVVG